MEYLFRAEKKFLRRIKSALRNEAKLPFEDGIRHIRVVRKTKLKLDDETKNDRIFEFFYFIVKF